MNLTELIRPFDTQTFALQYWERQPLFVTGRDADLYQDLFSLADVDHILSTPSLHSSTIRVIREGRGLGLDRLGLNGSIGDHAVAEALLAEHRLGATITLNTVNRTFASLRDLCCTLGRELSATVQVNVYLTPPASQGFDTHHDTHDVFILQVAGTKRWHVFQAPVELPLRDSVRPIHRAGSETLSDFRTPLLEVELQPGDLLYIPRGFPHHAVSAETTSLHLTIGAQTVTWATVIQAAVDACVANDARFRASLPPGFEATEAARRATADEFRRLVQVLAAGMEPRVAIDDAAEAVLRGQRGVLSGRLLDIESEPRVQGSTRVRRRPEVECAVSVDADRVCLRFNGKIVSVPSFAADEVQHLLDGKECTANQLPGSVDDQGRLVLVRRLIREGLLTISR